MAWIKRNLFFVIGSLVALGLMGYGGFRLYSAITNEQEVSTQIQTLYANLDALKKQNPHPGSSSPNKVDNVKAVQEQEAMLKAYLGKTRTTFVTPPPIPSAAKVTDKDFKTELSITIASLTRAAKESSVTLPTDYYFTFQSQKSMLQFEAGSLEKLASHLGEIKTICDILFSAKINALNAIQREVISPTMDQNATDYMSDKTMATSMADITPYRVVFTCFSAELADVMSGLASSHYGFVVKTINIDPMEISQDAGATTVAAPVMTPSPQQQFNSRYGNRYNPPPPPVNVNPAASAPTKPTVLVTEHPIKVTLMIEVIKLKSDAAPAKAGGDKAPAANPRARTPQQ